MMTTEIKDHPTNVLLALFREVFTQLTYHRGYSPEELIGIAHSARAPLTELGRLPQFQLVCFDTMPGAKGCIQRAERFGIPYSPSNVMGLSLEDLLVQRVRANLEEKLDTPLSHFVSPKDDEPEFYDKDEYAGRPHKAQPISLLDRELDLIALGRVDFDPDTPEGKEMLLLGWKPAYPNKSYRPSPPQPSPPPSWSGSVRPWKVPPKPLHRRVPSSMPKTNIPMGAPPKITPPVVESPSTVTINLSPTVTVTVTVAPTPN